MNVLVTGGTGSIGAWVTRSLIARDHTPIVIDFDPTLTYLRDVREEFTLIEGDVTDEQTVQDAVSDHHVDRIVHLAKILPSHSENNPHTALAVNVGGTGTVLKVAKDRGIDRVVFSSSKSVFAEITGRYGPPEFEPLPVEYPKFDRTTEEQIPFYTVTNKMVEYYGIRYAMISDFEFIILRFGSTWGPGKLQIQSDVFDEKPRETGGSLICRMVENAVRGRPITVKSSQTKTDNATYTKDVAEGVASAATAELDLDQPYREYLIDGGRVLNHGEFATVLEEQFEEFSFNTTDDDSGRSSHRTGTQCRFDLTRTRGELGYTPQYAEPRDAIDDYLDVLERFGAT